MTTTFSSSSCSQHPLLIAEIADTVLGYLAASANRYGCDNVNDLVLDLSSCFDVCLLWRSLVPPHVIRLRTRASRTPIVIQGTLTESEDPSDRGPAYLASVRKHPCFKTTKFSFRNVDLNSARVRELLRLNGKEIEELELWYDCHSPDRTREKKNSIIKKDPLTVSALEELLRKKLPNLETLIVRQLPQKIVYTHLFQIVSLHLGSGISGNSGPSYQTGELPVSAKLSKLRTIKLAVDFECEQCAQCAVLGPDSSPQVPGTRVTQGPCGLPRRVIMMPDWPDLSEDEETPRVVPERPPWPFLVGLLAAAPSLTEFELYAGRVNPESKYTASRAIKALTLRRRYENITSLKLASMDLDAILPLLLLRQPTLAYYYGRGGREFVRPQIPHLRHLSIGNVVVPETGYAARAVQIFLESQARTLKHLQFPIVGIQPRQIRFPRMKNLVKLQLYTKDKPVDPISIAWATPGGVLNYATQFPRLRVLGLKGLLQNYIVDEIFPDPLFGGMPPCTTVKVLQGIPPGVDQTLMARISRLFPNLSIIRTTIPYEHERLLVSVWEFCPNITQLYLTLDFDANADRHRLLDRSLDSIFTGINEPECRRLLNLPPEKLKQARPNCSREPSLRALKKLKRLVIEGHESSLGSLEERCESGPGWVVTRNPDHLSDVFGYFTLTSVVLQSRGRLEFVQISHGIADISSNCLKCICRRSGNKMKRVGRRRRWGKNFVRLVRKGSGVEGLGRSPLPRDWFGL